MDPELQDLYRRMLDGAEVVYHGRNDNIIRITTKECTLDDCGHVWTMTYYILTPSGTTSSSEMADDYD